MRRARTCCSSWITSSASRRLAPRCLPSLGEFPAPWATSLHWPLTWHHCRSASPQPRRAPLRPCKLSTCRPMTSQTQPPPPLLRTWMPRRCFPAKSPSSGSTPQLTRWIPPPECWTSPLWASAITTSPVAPRRRTSLRSWAWTSCLRKTSSRWREPARFSASCLSRSSWRRSSRTRQAPSWTWRPPSATSRKCWQAKAAFYMIGGMNGVREKATKL
ncbi:unnamed protein product, partial [Polarella glacialis]